MSSVLARSTADPSQTDEFARGALLRARAVAARALALSLPRFLAVGGLGLGTDACMFSALSAGGASDPTARLLSLGVATFVTWQLNRRFTFRASGRRAPAEAARYVVVALCAQGFNLAVFLGLRSAVPALPALGALAASAVLAAGISFTGQSLLTFRSRLAGPAPFVSGIRS